MSKGKGPIYLDYGSANIWAIIKTLFFKGTSGKVARQVDFFGTCLRGRSENFVISIPAKNIFFFFLPVSSLNFLFQLKWSDPDEEGLIEYMCKQKGFK